MAQWNRRVNKRKCIFENVGNISDYILYQGVKMTYLPSLSFTKKLVKSLLHTKHTKKGKFFKFHY